MSDMKLLPCPFCGGEARVVGGSEDWCPTFSDPDSGGQPISVVCECGVTFGFFDDYAAAIAAWNRRAPDIVRCCECEYYDHGCCIVERYEGDYHIIGVEPDDFCSYGKLKGCDTT